MSEQKSATERVARITAFAGIGCLNVVQEVAGACLRGIEGTDPELVAEETLCLVSTATSRAAAVGLDEEADVAAAVAAALYDLPFLYRDYLVASAMLASQDPALADSDDAVYERLQRKREFYDVHLPEGQFPGQRALEDKMVLWMGRISPPKLPEMPAERLEKLGLVAMVLNHLKLVLGYARKH